MSNYNYIDEDAVVERAKEKGVESWYDDDDLDDILQNINFEVREALERNGVIPREE